MLRSPLPGFWCVVDPLLRANPLESYHVPLSLHLPPPHLTPSKRLPHQPTPCFHRLPLRVISRCNTDAIAALPIALSSALYIVNKTKVLRIISSAAPENRHLFLRTAQVAADSTPLILLEFGCLKLSFLVVKSRISTVPPVTDCQFASSFLCLDQ